MKNRILVHTCCGPCAMYPLSRLLQEYDRKDITCFFYNPNIHPMEEFLKRRENAQKAAQHYGVEIVITEDFLMDKWIKYGPEENKLRCRMCYDLRLEHTVKYAKYNGFKSFTTTLLVSLWQDHDYIVKRCRELSLKYGVDFYYEDYRLGYRRGQEMAKETGLYRQKFCGCLWSAPNDLRESIISSYINP